MALCLTDDSTFYENGGVRMLHSILMNIAWNTEDVLSYYSATLTFEEGKKERFGQNTTCYILPWLPTLVANISTMVTFKLSYE
jgi:hypothetical protein